MPIANENLRRFREACGISRVRLARQAGVSAPTIKSAESGENVRERTLLKIILALSKKMRRSITLDEVVESDKKSEKINLLSKIPEQNDVIRFGVSTGGRLCLIPVPHEGDDVEAIEFFQGELLSEFGPIKNLTRLYNKSRNSPQAGVYSPLLERYLSEISKNSSNINFASLYAVGAKLYAARSAVNQQIVMKEWPELDAEEAISIDTICALHGPLIMSSVTGRRIVSQAHEYESTPQQFMQDEELFREFGDALSSEKELIEDETAQSIFEITNPIQGDSQPARSRGLRYLLAGSAMATIIGGAVWLSSGISGAAALPLFLVSAGSGKFLWEVIKKTDDFKSLTDNIAENYDLISGVNKAKISERNLNLLKTMKDFVDRKKDILQRMSKIRPEFEWVTNVLALEEKNLSKKINSIEDVHRKFDDYIYEKSIKKIESISNSEMRARYANALAKSITSPLRLEGSDAISSYDIIYDSKISPWSAEIFGILLSKRGILNYLSLKGIHLSNSEYARKFSARNIREIFNDKRIVVRHGAKILLSYIEVDYIAELPLLVSLPDRLERLIV